MMLGPVKGSGLDVDEPGQLGEALRPELSQYLPIAQVGLLWEVGAFALSTLPRAVGLDLLHRGGHPFEPRLELGDALLLLGDGNLSELTRLALTRAGTEGHVAAHLIELSLQDVELRCGSLHLRL